MCFNSQGSHWQVSPAGSYSKTIHSEVCYGYLSKSELGPDRGYPVDHLRAPVFLKKTPHPSIQMPLRKNYHFVTRFTFVQAEKIFHSSRYTQFSSSSRTHLKRELGIKGTIHLKKEKNLFCCVRFQRSFSTRSHSRTEVH